MAHANELIGGSVGGQPIDLAVYLAHGPELRIVWANASYLTLLGEPFSSGSAIGMRLDEVSILAPLRARALQEVMKTGEPQTGRDQLFSVEGGTVVYDWRAYRPIADYVLVMIAIQRIDGGHGEGRVVSDTEFLIAAETEARHIMDEARERAASVLGGAGGSAAVLLLEQGRRATDLLVEEQDLAISAAEVVAAEARGKSPAEANKYLASQRRAAEILRKRQAQITADLVETEAAIARSVDKEAQRAASALLMDAYREAAAVLLEARMYLEEGIERTSRRP